MIEARVNLEELISSNFASYHDEDQPVYQKLAESLRDAIRDELLVGGTRLPAERDLSELLRISRGSVGAAYDLLCSEGWLRAQQGSGTFVRDSGEDVTGGYLIGDDGSGNEVIEFTVAALPGLEALELGRHEDFVSSIAAYAAGHGYMPRGLEGLRRRIAEDYTRRGLPTTADEILITSGAQQAISLVSDVALRQGDVVLVESPTWRGALDAFRRHGTRLVAVDLDAEGMKVDALESLTDQHRPSLLYTTPSFHNPTGVQMSLERRAAIASLSRRENLIVVEDNALSELSLAGDPRPTVASFDLEAPIVTVGSLSKLVWGGLRVGWIRANSPMISRLSRAKTVADYGSSVVGQAMALHLMDSLDRIRDLRRAEIRDRYTHLVEGMRHHLPSWRFDEPAGGLSLWVQLPEGDGAEFAEYARRKQVVIVPGIVAAADGSFSDHIRVPFVHSPEVLTTALVRLADAWADYQDRLTNRAIDHAVIV